MEQTGQDTEHRDERALKFTVPLDEDGRLTLDAKIPVEGRRLVWGPMMLEEPDAEQIEAELEATVKARRSTRPKS